jgi:hypothetical protein
VLKPARIPRLEVVMRPYRVVDDELDEDPYPRVVPISSAPRAKAQAAERAASQREPWTPRNDDPAPAVPRPEPPAPPPARPREILSPIHQIMLATFFAVCIGMVLAMVAWRIWWQSPAAPASDTPGVEQPLASVTPTDQSPEPPEKGTGPVVTEIQVLQANYSVAQGDTLGTIALRHNMSVEALASFNNLENRNSLRVGQRLIIP